MITVAYAELYKGNAVRYSVPIIPLAQMGLIACDQIFAEIALDPLHRGAIFPTN